MYLQEYLIPILISNIIALVLLLAAWKAPRWARWSFVIIFLAAGAFNAFTASTTPEAYLTYGEMAIPVYQDFINGWFADNAQTLVTLIAIGQVVVALLLAWHGVWFRLGVVGGIIFLLAIAPLGVGSAFPCSVILATALIVLYWHYNKKNQVLIA